MPDTIISPLVHSPEEHAIVFMPSRESINKIVAIQKQLKTLLGDAIWLSPPHVLHSTLMEIICNTEYQGLSRKQHFDQWYDRYNEIAKGVIARFRPIEAHFTELFASPAAIILKAADPQPFNAVRAALLADAPLPVQTKMPPEIAHCTIARYARAVDLDAVREKAKAIPVDFAEHVSQFTLMKDLGPHFTPTALQTYSLGK